MAIEQNRIEALAEWMFFQFIARRPEGAPRRTWAEADLLTKKLWRREAREHIAIAFPELASDPPKAWVAPWIATEAMRTSMARVTSDEQRVDATVHRSKAKIYEAMRDAHLKEQYERITLEMHEAAAKAVRSRPRGAHLKEQGHE